MNDFLHLRHPEPAAADRFAGVSLAVVIGCVVAIFCVAVGLVAWGSQ